MKPAAEPTQNQKAEFLGVQAEVLIEALPVYCFLHCHNEMRHCNASPTFS